MKFLNSIAPSMGPYQDGILDRRGPYPNLCLKMEIESFNWPVLVG